MHDTPPVSRPYGFERQMQIYLGSLQGQTPNLPIAMDILEEAAHARMSPQAWGYVAGAAGFESTSRANREAFQRWQIVPRMLRDVSQRDLSISLLGKHLPAPILLAPIGVQEIVHPDAEIAVAQAAAKLEIPLILSTVSSKPMEAVAQTLGDVPRWFQLYWGKNFDLTANLVQRAERAGYSAIVVTLDTNLLSWRPQDLQQAYLPFLKGEGLANYFSDPVFRQALDRPPEEDPFSAIQYFLSIFSNPSLTWNDLAFLRQHTSLPIILKGILHPDDAQLALDHGVDGLIVSNHGGRQVDGALSSLAALPPIVARVADQVPVLFDSGIRYGADLFKALALGAKAVLLGRPYIWGLSLAGADGVYEVIQNFLADTDLTLALSGNTTFRDLQSNILVQS